MTYKGNSFKLWAIPKTMICLGIEGTAHTLGFSIVNSKGEILSEVRSMYRPKKGGLILNEVADHHKKAYPKLFKECLDQAKIKFEDIDLIAYSQAPGLAPSLVVTRDIAVKIKKDKPLIGVNHIAGHLEIGKLLTNAKDPVFVFVSGANTQIIAHEGKKYRIFGEALSIAAGNAFDKFGREIGLPFPAGAEIEEIAKKGKYIELPYSVKGMDVEFSGVLTSAIRKYQQGASKEDVCYSMQETVFSMLTEVTERAMAHTGKKECLVIGGVAASKRFNEMLNIMCKERGAKAFACPLKYSGDNGAQIAVQGLLEYKAGRRQKIFDILPRQRIDDVETIWI